MWKIKLEYNKWGIIFIIYIWAQKFVLASVSLIVCECHIIKILPTALMYHSSYRNRKKLNNNKIRIPHEWWVTYGNDPEWKHKNSFPRAKLEEEYFLISRRIFFRTSLLMNRYIPFITWNLPQFFSERQLYSIYAWRGRGLHNVFRMSLVTYLFAVSLYVLKLWSHWPCNKRYICSPILTLDYRGNGA